MGVRKKNMEGIEMKCGQGFREVLVISYFLSVLSKEMSLLLLKSFTERLNIQ